MEKYQKDYGAYQQKKQTFLHWENENRRNNAIASKNFANTDEALKYYNRTHEDEHLPDEPPKFSDYYRPLKNQKFGEMVYVVGSIFALGYIVTRFLWVRWLKIFEFNIENNGSRKYKMRDVLEHGDNPDPLDGDDDTPMVVL